MSISLKKAFEVKLWGFSVALCGEDYSGAGRRQIVPCPEGEIIGPDFRGSILPGGIDHQVIRNDGVCEISAAYGFRFEDGRSLYIKAEGIRVPPAELVDTIKLGKGIDPKLFYYITTPKIETYDESLLWMNNKVFVCDAVRLPDAVLLTYYTVEQVNDHPALG